MGVKEGRPVDATRPQSEEHLRSSETTDAAAATGIQEALLDTALVEFAFGAHFLPAPLEPAALLQLREPAHDGHQLVGLVVIAVFGQQVRQKVGFALLLAGTTIGGSERSDPW